MLGTYEPYAGNSKALQLRDMKRAEKIMLGTYEPYAGHSKALCLRDTKTADNLC